jgi:hypothetical protein
LLEFATGFLHRRQPVCIHPNGELSIDPSESWTDRYKSENGTKNEAHHGSW